MYQYRQVVVRMRLGESDRAIAKTDLMGRTKCKEVRAIANQFGWLDKSKPLPTDDAIAEQFTVKKPEAGNIAPNVSKVEPYRDEVKRWREDGVQGTTIYQTLQRKHDFSGSYSSVRRFINSIDETLPKVTSVIPFDPGDSAQIDFGQGPKMIDVFTGEEFKTWVFVMVLSWSRHMYAELVRDQSVETWLGCHRRSFEWFNGVPTRCIIDNPKCAITKACYHEPKVQRAYGDYAEGYGFLISPCPVRDPQKKGRVESGVKYVKNNFVPLREFRSLTDANQQLKQWVRDEAGQRIHGTVQEKPLTRFTEVEQALLKPLPDKPPLLARWVNPKCHSDCHIQIEKSFYSVPEIWVNQHLWARVSETLVEIFNEQLLITAHKRLKKAGLRSTVQDHLPSQAKAYHMRDPQWCLAKSKEVGASCHALIEHLFANRVLDNLRAAQGVIGFRKAYGDKRLEAACERAWAFETPLYKTVKSILRQGLDQQPNDVSTTTPLSDAYRGDGRYCRDSTDLLTH